MWSSSMLQKVFSALWKYCSCGAQLMSLSKLNGLPDAARLGAPSWTARCFCSGEGVGVIAKHLAGSKLVAFKASCCCC